MESSFSTVKSERGEHFEAYGIGKEKLRDYIEQVWQPLDPPLIVLGLVLGGFSAVSAAMRVKSELFHQRVDVTPCRVTW
jgi:hypothetical protein